jgi:two-component system cell cycle sensor histidine kinase/response regulator CckA
VTDTANPLFLLRLPAEGQPLRMLCADDSPRDVKLMTEVLEGAGYILALDSVDKLDLFRERLEQDDYDIIICDFNLNVWTAFDALEVLRKSGKDVPLVVVSGSLGDEAAVDCIKRGATDYVLKDRMARLPSAIQHALEAKSARDDQRKAESVLRQSAEQYRLLAEQYRLLFEGNPNPMWVFDTENLAILAVNEVAIRFYGYSQDEFLRMTMGDLRSPEEVPQLLAGVAGATMPIGSSGAFKHLHKSGVVIDVEIASSPIVFQGRSAWLGLVNDVTERNSLQAQFLQAQKMESLGRLAGGVAHDLNNLLGVVLGYGELTQERLDPTSPLHRNLEGIQKAARQAVSVVRQLLAFSRKQIQQPRMLDLNTIVGGMEELLKRLIGEDVHLSIVTEADLGTIRADPGQIEQVIMNLAVNARDAMPRGGQLIIRTANVEGDQGAPWHELDCPTGPHVVLEVSDTGCGMDAETRARIFEPFFTTKDLGKGTGLGLATVYGIVKQSEGSIAVLSELGHGTTFRVCLPRVEAAPQAAIAAKPSGEARGGSETILLVEDDEPLREVVRAFLQDGGYNILVAEDSGSAVAVFAKYPSKIHLLLTDVVMPGISGPQLARELCLADSSLRVLFMSGYTDEALGQHGVLEEGIALLEKPFTSGALLRKLRDVLDPVASSMPGGLK